MISDAFSLGETIKLHTINFKLCPELWNDFQFSRQSINDLNWTELKFLNSDATDFSTEIEELPNDKGGIYLFIIKSDILPSTSEYLAYIGRAQLTDGHSLRVRIRKYFTTYLNDKERPKITRLMKYYAKHLFLKYAPLDSNESIVDLEAELINSLLPPFNDQIPDKRTREAVNAF